jgi:DNA-3-methyladenine glycosylase II
LIPYSEILELFKKDPILHKAIMESEKKVVPELDIDIYRSLVGSIVSQQLSTKVVRVIWNRFLDLFPDRYPEAKLLLATEHQSLRKVGLSNSKANYVKNVAEFGLNNDMSFDYLDRLTDDEIIDYLSQIKGVGKWTVQMILMFPMDRPDVFPSDDLGIQNIMKKLYQLDFEKKELKIRMNSIADQWRPYRTLASKYLWEIADQ